MGICGVFVDSEGDLGTGVSRKGAKDAKVFL